MRASTLVGAMLLPGLALAAPKSSGSDQPAAAEKPRPRVRQITVKTGTLQFRIRQEPGVPAPGRVVELAVEAAEVPPVPDPVYGERIPLKNLQMVARVTDAAGEGYPTAYLMHGLSDAGQYGLHFTPLRRDIYLVEMMGRHRGRAFKASFKVPVDMWPFPPGSDPPPIDAGDGAQSARLPALPSTMQGPARPAQPGQAASPARAASAGKVDAWKQAMHKLAVAMAAAGAAFELGRRPDLAAAARALAGSGQYLSAARQGAGNRAGMEAGLDELERHLRDLERAIKSRRAKRAQDAYRRVVQACTGCHLQHRWRLKGHEDRP